MPAGRKGEDDADRDCAAFRSVRTMPLEIVTEMPAQPSSAAPLMFVHGAWHGAWCWRHFLSFFARNGHAAHALSLRGHGASPAPRALRMISIRDYVEDLVQAVRTLPSPPALVGHSMGGFVVHHYLQAHPARGAVFLASVPPSGAWRATWHALRRHPLAFACANARLSLYPMVATVDRARDLLFSREMSRSQAAEYQVLLQDESYRAYLEMLLRPVRRVPRARCPVLVLNAAEDALIDETDMRSTGAFYGSEPQLIPGIAHDMMLEPRWQEVAERILCWLRGL